MILGTFTSQCDICGKPRGKGNGHTAYRSQRKKNQLNRPSEPVVSSRQTYSKELRHRALQAKP